MEHPHQTLYIIPADCYSSPSHIHDIHHLFITDLYRRCQRIEAPFARITPLEGLVQSPFAPIKPLVTVDDVILQALPMRVYLQLKELADRNNLLVAAIAIHNEHEHRKISHAVQEACEHVGMAFREYRLPGTPPKPQKPF